MPLPVPPPPKRQDADRNVPLQWLKRLAPVAVSAAILYYYLHGLDFDQLLQIGRRVNLPLAVAAVVVPQLVSWYLGSLLMARTIQWFHAPFDLRAMFWVRGAAYILMFLNSALGGGGLLLYQQKRAELSWEKLLGIVLFRVGLGLWCIGLVMIPLTLLLQFSALGERFPLNITAWWAVLIGGALWLVEAWLMWHHGRIYGLSKLLAGDGSGEFWTAFRESSPRQWWLTWLMILPQLIVVVLGYTVLNHAFGIHVPLIEALVVTPFALLVMDLPIAMAGFGTATLAWMTFFGHHGNEADIVALTLFLPLTRSLVRAVIGALSLRPAMKELSALLGPR